MPLSCTTRDIAPYRPQTLRQAKKAYQQATKAPKKTAAEFRKLQREENERNNAEWARYKQRERDKLKREAAKRKRQEAEDKDREERRKAGRPLKDVSSSQMSLKTFFVGLRQPEECEKKDVGMELKIQAEAGGDMDAKLGEMPRDGDSANGMMKRSPVSAERKARVAVASLREPLSDIQANVKRRHVSPKPLVNLKVNSTSKQPSSTSKASPGLTLPELQLFEELADHLPSSTQLVREMSAAVLPPFLSQKQDNRHSPPVLEMPISTQDLEFCPEDLVEADMNSAEEGKTIALLERSAVENAPNEGKAAENKPVKRQLRVWNSFSSEDFGLTSKDLDEFLKNEP
jgi:hypothetical protein